VEELRLREPVLLDCASSDDAHELERLQYFLVLIAANDLAGQRSSWMTRRETR